MANQFSSQEEVYSAIKGGDASVARMFAQGEYRQLPDRVEEQEQFEEEDTGGNFAQVAVGVAPTIHEEEGSFQEDEEDEDPRYLEKQRELFESFSEEKKSFQDALDEERAKREALEGEHRKMQKHLEELRRDKEMVSSSYDEDDDDSFDLIGPNVASAVKTVSESEPTKEGFAKEVEELKRWKEQVEEERAYESTVGKYKSFWDSELGKDLAPSGNPRDAIDGFVSFYDTVVKKMGSRGKANMLMQDVTVRGINKDKLEKLGVDVPKDFDKMFRSFEVELFAEGRAIDKFTGDIRRVHKNSFTSLDDAYAVMHKNKPAVLAKKQAIEDIQKKMSQRESSAVTVEADRYQPFPTSNRFHSNDYIRNLLVRSKASGLKSDMNPLSIKDPSIRNEFMEYNAYMKSIARNK